MELIRWDSLSETRAALGSSIKNKFSCLLAGAAAAGASVGAGAAPGFSAGFRDLRFPK